MLIKISENFSAIDNSKIMTDQESSVSKKTYILAEALEDISEVSDEPDGHQDVNYIK